MAEKSSFFNSVGGDRKYAAEDWAAYFSSFISNGVFADPSNSLQVIADSGMNISIRVGSAFINGYYYRNTSALSKTIAVANGSMARIDRVVLRWSLANRNITINVKQGQYSNKPTPPELTRSVEVYELALADIKVSKGITAITQSMITDKRAVGNLCGFVTGVIDQFDFSTMCTQFDAFFDEYENKIHDKYISVGEELDDWFENLQYIMDGDVAGHLQNQIDRNARDIRLKQNKVDVVGIPKVDSSGNFQTAIVGGDYGALAFTVTLSPTAWTDDNIQTISNENFKVNGCCFEIDPAPSSMAEYADANIYADNVTVDNQMTFHCDYPPDNAIAVNIIRLVTGAGGTLTEGIQLVKGDKGEAFTYADFTAKQLADLKGENGADGKDFTFEDFTPEQLATLKGERGNGIVSVTKTGTDRYVDTYTITFDDGQTTTYTVTNGTPLTYDMLTDVQKAELSGNVSIADGSIDGGTKLVDSSLTKAKLDSSVRATLDKADSALQSLPTHDHTTSDITDFPTDVSAFNNDSGYLTELADGSVTMDKIANDVRRYLTWENAIEIPEGADLNDYIDIGVYTCPVNARVPTLINFPTSPAGNYGFNLRVSRALGTYFLQTLVLYNGRAVAIRGRTLGGLSANWSAWNVYYSSALQIAFTVTLPTTGWTAPTDTVEEYTIDISNANFVVSGYSYIVKPAWADYTKFADLGIFAQDVTTAGKMKFHSSDVPTEALTVNVLRVPV